jgi:hypothetical protein
MKKITIIAAKDIEGFFPMKAGEVIRSIDGLENVTKIEADSKNISIYYKNGLHEVYITEYVRLEVEQ